MLDELGASIGWGQAITNWPNKIIGWLLSALAFSLGAPFWFQIINKFINLQSAGTTQPAPAPAAQTDKSDTTSTTPVAVG